jgi:hypothetical protein
MTKRADETFSDVLRAKASVILPDLDHEGAMNAAEIIASRGWFDEYRRRLKSSGGRPTDPSWKLKRQIPFAPATWELLKELAAACSAPGQRIGPGQVAGFLLAEAVRSRRFVVRELSSAPADQDTTLIETVPDDPRFREWTMPKLFSGGVS